MLPKIKITLKPLLFCLLILGGLSLRAQEYSLGLKGGINYSFDVNAAEVSGSAGDFSTDSRAGYQAGVFFELNFGNLYLRPEVFYSRVAGEFPFPDMPSLYSIDKISIPLLAGYKIYGPFSIFAGPAYQHFLRTELESTRDELLIQQKNIAGQFGIMYEYRRFQVDLRYDFSFSSKKNQVIDIQGVMKDAYFDDGRLNQFMLSLNYKLFDPGLPRLPIFRQRSCYF